MSKINFLCLTAISLTFIACSGKVQTNPLPESKQFVLPKSQVVLTNQVSKHRVDDFDKFLADFFSKRKKVVVVDNIYKNKIDKSEIKNSKKSDNKYAITVPATKNMSSNLLNKAVSKSELNIKGLFEKPNKNLDAKNEVNCEIVSCGKELKLTPNDRKNIWSIGIEKGLYAR